MIPKKAIMVLLFVLSLSSLVILNTISCVMCKFTGIVLDRGSAIVGLTMDLLYPSEKDTLVIGRQRNINFQVKRWGW